MTSPMAELSTAQCKKEYNDTGDHSTRDCCSEKICYVHPDSAGTPVWKGPSSEISLPVLIPHPHQYTLQPEILDPLSLRFHCPYQSTQCLLTYPYDLQQPQSSQYHLLAGSHHYPVSGSWFTNEPICCSMMQGDLHNSVAMDYQQFQEGLPEDTPYIKQPVMCSVSGDGQVGLVDPFESGPVEKHRDDGLTQVKDCGVLGSPCQTPCPLYESIVQASNMQPQTPPARTFATMCESKSRKPCHCTRSQCLKLYCECFANGAMCINCDCSNCHNNSEHQMKRHKAIKSCLGRNPDAFRPKIAGGKSGVVKGRHNKGCNCKRSGCLKNYCECYEANIMCTSSCKCVGCRNYDKGSQTSLKWKTDNVEDRRPEFVITSSVVEAVCGCLLAQAEREAQSPAQAEQSILEEFGHCLSQIVKTVFE